VTPHIGASTVEGQFRVGTEIATLVADKLKG
jgi:phosphoglycerate dehydrogenase-like enzyme